MGDVIDINVGGVVFTTTLSTLTKYEDSMLGKMFSGRLDTAKDSLGRIFLDRDGNLFRHVLYFLRTDELLFIEDFSELQQLLCEADFYQIQPLIDAVKGKLSWRKGSKRIMGDVIDINVGGVVFTTTLSTLTKYEDSMLGKMFSGRSDTAKDSLGRIFLDRDGNLFRHVLYFLRTDELLFTEDFSELQQLLCEADFYQIQPFIDAVKRTISWRKGPKETRYFSLDVMESITLYTGPISSWCEKIMMLCGNLDVIRGLGFDCRVPDVRCENHQISVGNDENYVYSGDSVQIFLHTYKFTSNLNNRGPRSEVNRRTNRSDFTDTLLAANCKLVSSSSQFKKPQEDTLEQQCYDKWLVPASALNN